MTATANVSYAVQAVARGPMTVAPPSFNGHGWLVVVNLAGFTAGFIIATMLALQMIRDIRRNWGTDKLNRPVTVWRAFGGAVSAAIAIRFGPAAMVLWGWDPTNAASTAWLLTFQRLTDPIAFTMSLLALAMFEISGKGMSEHLKRQLLPLRIWAKRDQLKRPWDYNSKRADDELGLNGALTSNYDRALETEISAQVMVLGMTEGWFTTRKFGSYLPAKGPATRVQFTAARLIINGIDRAEKVAGLAMSFQAALVAGGWA